MNNIVMLFPQLIDRNSGGCWDVNGSDGDDFGMYNFVRFFIINGYRHPHTYMITQTQYTHTLASYSNKEWSSGCDGARNDPSGTWYLGHLVQSSSLYTLSSK